MIISSSRMSTALSIPECFDIGNGSVQFSDTVKNLGVTLDCHLSLKTHVLNLVHTANFELRRISSIRRLLTTEATATLVSAFILSRLDYCNSLLSGCPDLWFSVFKRFRTMQLVLSSGFLNVSIFPLTLPLFIGYPLILVSSTNLHVFATTACLLTLRPTSLTFLPFTPLPVRQLRSSSDNSVLRRPSVRTVSYGQRSFAYSAPSAWNSLPQQVRSSDNVSTFRSRTKTHLFRLAY